VAHPTKLKKEIKGEYAGKYGPPTLYDISDSAHWFNGTDNGICVWRDVEAKTLETEIHIQKIRLEETGQTGMVTLRYNPATKTYADMGSM
jgi:twinkle protein